MCLRKMLIAAAVCSLLTGCQPQITGVYSNLEFDRGKTQGMEIFIVQGGRTYGNGDDYFAYVQCAHGTPGRPVVVKISIHMDEVSIPAILDPESGCPSLEFKGAVSPSGIDGRFSGQPLITLPRRKSAWQ